MVSIYCGRKITHMVKHTTLLNIFYLIATLVIVAGCGNRRDPTGGPVDVVKPEVLACVPAEYGDLGKGSLEITFSKPLDKNSIANSIYIYPPVEGKKISLDGNTLKLKITETLKKDTNYFVTLTTRLKDQRGNALAKNQTLVFKSGELQDNRIAGTIKYENPQDMGLPVDISLFAADSLLVLSKQIIGGAFTIDGLNPQKHLLKAYIDKNLNSRYDYGLEPYCEGWGDGSKISTLELEMAYADSSLPRISKLVQLSDRELRVELSEPIKSYKTLQINGKSSPDIAFDILEQDKITVLCSKLDSLEYTLLITDAMDNKGNKADKLESKFRYAAQPDTIAPAVSWSNPRNGASVNSLNPILELYFSEVIPGENLKVKLYAGTKEIAVKQLSATGRVHRFQAVKELDNYKAYTLKVLPETRDFSGNKMKNGFDLQFLPLKRN